MPSDLLDKLAYDLIKTSFEEERRKQENARMAPSLNQFTKFDASMAPETYLQIFEDELSLCNLQDESHKMKYLPLLMTGKAAYIIDQLRECHNWYSMCAVFSSEFAVD